METKFTKSTDTEHEVKLESTFVSALWQKGFAIAGQKASLEVLTAFVGQGASIKITGKSESGKNVGKISDEIKNNKFVGQLDIPADVPDGDRIYFEADLSADGISGESNHIVVYPPINVTNMKWSVNEARRGDFVTLTADAGGAKDGMEATLTIFEYDRDNVHDKIVELPADIKNQKIEVKWEYEYHEDTDEIPSDEELQRYGRNYSPPEYFFTVTIGDAVFGKKQESGLLLFKDWIEIDLTDADGNPRADQEFTLYYPDGTTKDGKLDGQGHVRLEGIPPGDFKIVYKNVFPDTKKSQTEDTGSAEGSPEGKGQINYDSSSGGGGTEEEEPLQA